MPAFKSGKISGIAENECMATVQLQAAITAHREGKLPEKNEKAKNPGITYRIFEYDYTTGLALKRIGLAL